MTSPDLAPLRPTSPEANSADLARPRPAPYRGRGRGAKSTQAKSTQAKSSRGKSRTEGQATTTEQLTIADLPKPRVVETALQRAVIDLAHLRGWLVFHAYDSRKSTGPGWPDLAMCHPGQKRLLFVELKTDTGRLSPDQHRWLLALNAAGAECDVWRPRHLADGIIAAILAGTPTRWTAP